MSNEATAKARAIIDGLWNLINDLRRERGEPIESVPTPPDDIWDEDRRLFDIGWMD